MVKEIPTRHIKEPVKLMLWGMAAGRCEFTGCNKQLWKSSITQEKVNIAQNAHIYSFSEGGPRGNKKIPVSKINDLSNLLLVCHQCHKKIDKDKDGGRYTADLLKKMKADHESRIELVTGINPDNKSHVLLYGANIGSHSSPLSFETASIALFPLKYPAEDRAIELGIVDSSSKDHEKRFWQNETDDLNKKFNLRVRERFARGEVKHLSVFALAPQPLMILLGSLLTDIPGADVYQLHREPQGWGWPSRSGKLAYIVHEPSQIKGAPVLVISLSATIARDRIESVLGDKISIWEVTIKNPNNDFLKTRKHLQDFRILSRKLMDKIKARHGHGAILHIFPAMAVSTAVELGRIRMPKADLSWRIYDQNNAKGRFVHAIDIK